MPRGGHKGGIFPVSGLPWGMNRWYLKRGLYQHRRDHIFTPRWGTRTDAYNPSPLPDGSTRRWENDSHKAWPLRGNLVDKKSVQTNRIMCNRREEDNAFGTRERETPGRYIPSQDAMYLSGHLVTTALSTGKLPRARLSPSTSSCGH